MGLLWYIVFSVFLIDGVLLIIAILLQSGRGGGLAGALGGIGSPDSALGVRAASQIEKATGVLVAILFVCALVLAYMGIGKSPWSAKQRAGQGLEEVLAGAGASVPAGVSLPAKSSKPASATMGGTTTLSGAVTVAGAATRAGGVQ